MNPAGKKLQDIFDSGSSKLADLEKSGRTTIGATIQHHQSAVDQQAEENLRQIRTKGKNLNADIDDVLLRGLERVQTAIEREKSETDRCVQRLLSGIAQLGKRMEDSILDTKVSHASQVISLTEDICGIPVKESDALIQHLDKRAAGAVSELKSSALHARVSAHAECDRMLSVMRETRGEQEKDLLASFLENAERVKSCWLEHAETLSLAVQGQRQVLEVGLKESEQLLEEAVNQLIVRAAGTKEALTEGMDSEFLELSNQCIEESAGGVKRDSAELQCLSETVSTEMTSKVEELSGDLLRDGKTLVQILSKQANDVAGKVDAAFVLFQSDCDRRLKSSLTRQRDIEAKGDEILSGISRELEELLRAFEVRLGELADSSIHSLQLVCQTAASSIEEAKARCSSELSGLGGVAGDEVLTVASELLGRIEEKSRSALSEIDRAAAVEPVPGDGVYPSAGKRRDRKGRKKSSSPESHNAGPSGQESSGGFDAIS